MGSIRFNLPRQICWQGVPFALLGAWVTVPMAYQMITGKADEFTYLFFIPYAVAAGALILH